MEYKINLLEKTKLFALKIIKLVDEIPNKPSGWVISKQISGSGTSVGANYRAVKRAKSTADFINKLKIVEEECDETLYWLDLLKSSGMIDASRIIPLEHEGNEILSMVVASIKTVKSNNPR